jgi:hypothetical protein
MTNFSDDIREKVQPLIDEINKGAEWAEENAKSEESCNAEFCLSFGYGEDKPDLSRLEPEVAAKVQRLLDRVKTRKDIEWELTPVCNLECVGMFYVENEIYSVGLGEIEEQLPEELVAKLKALTDEEFKCVQKYVDTSIADCREYIYINCDYDRFVMVIDEDRLDERLAEIDAESEVESN